MIETLSVRLTGAKASSAAIESCLLASTGSFSSSTSVLRVEVVGSAPCSWTVAGCFRRCPGAFQKVAAVTWLLSADYSDQWSD